MSSFRRVHSFNDNLYTKRFSSVQVNDICKLFSVVQMNDVCKLFSASSERYTQIILNQLNVR